jgi:hypothetical protein
MLQLHESEIADAWDGCRFSYISTAYTNVIPESMYKKK